MKNDLFKKFVGLLSLLAVLFVTSCSDDDGEAQVEVNIESGDYVVYASKGELQIPLTVSGLAKEPLASDFSATISSFQWEEDLDASSSLALPELKVKGIEKKAEGTYILTVSYDITGYTECSYSVQIVYRNSTLAGGVVKVNCYPYSNYTIELPLQELTIEENNNSLNVDIYDAWELLGIRVPGYNDQHKVMLYGGLEGDVLTKNVIKTENGKTVFLSQHFFLSTVELDSVSLKPAKELAKGVTYGVLVIVPTEDGKSVGVYRSFIVK